MVRLPLCTEEEEDMAARLCMDLRCTGEGWGEDMVVVCMGVGTEGVCMEEEEACTGRRCMEGWEEGMGEG